MRSLSSCLVCAALLILALASTPAGADELWRQNPINAVGGYSSQDARNPGGLGWFSEVADNFTAADGWVINHVEFWGGYASDVHGDAQGFTIRFYADNNGAIGQLLSMQDVFTFTETPFFGGVGGSYDTNLDLPTPFAVPSAGTYWMSVVCILDRGGSANEPQWGWVQTAGVNPPAAQQWFFMPGVFTTTNIDMSFVLDGISVDPTMGACCAASGACVRTAPDGCASGFQGLSTVCSPNPCGGACCNAGGGCTVTTAATCGSGSLYLNHATCSTTACVGACCNAANGACTTASFGGCPSGTTFQGSGTSCVVNPCPQPPTGACCTGSCGGCVTLAASDCSAQSGTYHGDSSTCDVAGCSIINAGFESGAFAPGWTQFGDTSFTAVFSGPFGTFSPHGGNFAAYFGPTAVGGGGIMQTIPAHAGDQVTIGFWYGVENATPNSFEADFDGQTLVSFTNDVTNLTWTQFTFPVTVSADNPTLMFTFTNPPSYSYLDDVTVCIQSSTGSGVCCRGATCNNAVTQANCTTGVGRAGAHFVSSASACGSGAVSSSPCCYADYNKTGGITVQDIFDFLSDWFAGRPFAKVGGNGATGVPTVQNIFDFLTNWFAGGC